MLCECGRKTWTRIAGFAECRECYSKREVEWSKDKIEVGGNAIKGVENMKKEKYEIIGDFLFVESLPESDTATYKYAEKNNCKYITEKQTGKTIILTATTEDVSKMAAMKVVCPHCKKDFVLKQRQ